MSFALCLAACGLSGVALATAGMHASFGWLACLALVPLALNVRGATSCFQATGLGAVFSLGWSLPTIEWIANLGFHSDGWTPYAVGWVFLTLLFATTHAAATALLYWLWAKRGWSCTLALAVAWSSWEWTADALLRGGFGLSLDPICLAATQLDCGPFAQWAAVGGTLLVATLVAAVNGLVVDALEACRRRDPPSPAPRAVAATAVLLGAFAFYGVMAPRWDDSSEGPAILLVPQVWGEDSGLDLHSASSCDLIVWPESAMSGVLNLDDSVEPSLRAKAQQLGVPIVVGCRRFCAAPIGVHNCACLVHPNGRPLETSDKRFCGPLAEFRPPLAIALGVAPAESSLVGGQSNCWTLPTGHRLGVGICHDASFPEWSRDLCAQRPDFLLLIANESFTDSPRLRRQMLACARLRAIESRRAVVRCVQSGVSCVIDAHGSIIAQTTTGATSPLLVSVSVTRGSSNTIDQTWGGVWSQLTFLGIIASVEWLYRVRQGVDS